MPEFPSPDIPVTSTVTKNDHEVQGNFLEGLSNDISEMLPALKKGTNILLEGTPNHYETADNVLRGHVCGRAVRVLGYQLRKKGYNAEGVSTQLLDTSGNYPTYDHALLRVTDPSNEVPIIVDPAYQQFIRMFHLPDDLLPSEEVLVVSADQVRKKAEEFALLRDSKLRTHSNPSIFSDYQLFQMPHEQLVGHFERVWTLGNYPDKTTKLEDDIEKYKQDPQSVSELTRKLLEQVIF